MVGSQILVDQQRNAGIQKQRRKQRSSTGGETTGRRFPELAWIWGFWVARLPAFVVVSFVLVGLQQLRLSVIWDGLVSLTLPLEKHDNSKRATASCGQGNAPPEDYGILKGFKKACEHPSCCLHLLGEVTCLSSPEGKELAPWRCRGF